MPQTWEWGPLAQGMAEEAVRRQKQREIDAMMQRQEMANRSAVDVAGANRAAALEQMIRGKDLDMAKARELQAMKEAATEREYQTEVPALRKFMAGPGGKIFGYGEIPQDPFATEPMQPTNAELRGYAPALKAMMQAAAQHAFPKPEGDFTLGPGQTRFGPGGKPLATSPELQTGFGTQSEVETAIAKSASPGRTGYRQDTKTGRFYLQGATTEPLTQSYAQWTRTVNDPTATPGDRALAQKNISDYEAGQSRMAGGKASAAEQAKALPTDLQNYIATLATVKNSQKLLSTFTPQEEKTFIGTLPSGRAWTQDFFESWPGASAILRAFGGDSQKVRDRYKAFQTAHAPIGMLAFGPAGKQLTGIEKEMVLANLITGKEWSYTEYKAKKVTFQLYLRAHEIAVATLTRLGRKDVPPEVADAISRAALNEVGLGDIYNSPLVWQQNLTKTEKADLYLDEKMRKK